MPAALPPVEVAEALWAQVLDPILVTDGTGEIRFATRRAHHVYRLDEPGATGLADLVHPDDRQTVLKSLQELIQTGRATDRLPARLRVANGTWRDIDLDVSNLLNHASVNGLVLTLRDASSRRLADEALVHRALHDPLTGLPNRALLTDRLAQGIARARRQHREIAVLFLDLDNFKMINDSLGHEAGDLLLIEVAHRLLDAVRAGDTVARFGGDEFAILLEGVVDADEARAGADRVATALREPMELMGRKLSLNASIGIALSDRRSDQPEDLIREADLAMYYAKEHGRGGQALFDPAMQARADARLELETEFRRALETGQLQLHYQPIVALGDTQLTGFEALVRWQRPGFGLIPPADFVPIAEETGLIVPMGSWVLREACFQLREWQQNVTAHRNLTVGVNLSVRQLEDPGLLEVIESALQDSGVDPATLVLEITESVLVNDAEATIRVLHQIKALGVRIAIDDFGTGYSSLSYLKRLPIDIVKIDQSFIKGLGLSIQDQELVRGMLDMAASLELTTTAEGIETDEQLAALIDLGGTSGQGFLFARPLPPAQIHGMLNEEQAAA